jgi:nickel/cobalt transporter (NicO) family protein
VNNTIFITIAVTGFTVAFLHAAIPTHWLPFVVAARAQHWNHAKTLGVTGIAGAGHVLFTTALGVLLAWGGIAINVKWSKTFPLIAGGALVVVGLLYLARQFGGGPGHVHLLGGHSHHGHEENAHQRNLHEHHHVHHHLHELGHDHSHDHPSESEEIERQWSQRRSDWAVIGGLVALLTFSPCEAFLPVFLTGAKYGWLGFAVLSAILAIATVAGMVVFTWLTLKGLQRFRFKALEKWEPTIVGLVFCLLGLIIILFEH